MKTLTSKYKKLILLVAVSVFVAVLIQFQTAIFDGLYYVFAMMLVLAILLIQQGDANYAVIALLMQFAVWFIFSIILKFTVFNMLFPKIRVVDELKNGINYARKIKTTTGSDPRFVYLRVKFKFFPVFRWHTFKIPKPEYRGKRKVEYGVPGVMWRRMPSSIDIVTSDINMEWNEDTNVYQLTPKLLPRIAEDVSDYRMKTKDTITRLSQNVNESVRGDASLLKDQYQTGIPISMELVTPTMQKIVKEPPMKPELKKVINTDITVDALLGEQHA